MKEIDKTKFSTKILSEKFSIALLYIGIGVLLSSIAPFLWNEWQTLFTDNKIQADKIAQFGDFIGGTVGSIWALAGVVLFYVALKEQRSDFRTNKEALESQTEALKLQIKEFELQRKELEETREVFKIQNETMAIQKFESTFFNLLSNHHEIVNAMRINFNNNNNLPIEKVGRDVFHYSYKALSNKLEILPSDLNTPEAISSIYFEVYTITQNNFAHYFRNLSSIIKFINNSESITESDKLMYASMISSQLSDYELLWLFYDGLIINQEFKPLIMKYSLLKNMRIDELHNQSFMQFYDNQEL